jgi:hypothetical protein
LLQTAGVQLGLLLLGVDYGIASVKLGNQACVFAQMSEQLRQIDRIHAVAHALGQSATKLLRSHRQDEGVVLLAALQKYRQLPAAEKILSHV